MHVGAWDTFADPPPRAEGASITLEHSTDGAGNNGDIRVLTGTGTIPSFSVIAGSQTNIYPALEQAFRKTASSLESRGRHELDGT